jgi:hypothetical protein
MGKKTLKDEESSMEFDDLELQVYEAFLARGWIIPQTEAEVSRAEAEMVGECDELPAELRDPYAVLSRALETGAKVLALHPVDDEEMPKQLARAAREGKDIPPEIEERMRHDREAAEREATDD